MEMKPFVVYTGAREIGAAVGIPWKEIKKYVERKGLPAFKIDGHGKWLALPGDLLAWIEAARDEQLGRKQ